MTSEPGDHLERAWDDLAPMRDRVTRDEQAIAQRAEVTFSAHPRSARLVAIVRGVLREQSAEQVGLAASGAAFWLVITAFPTAIAAVSLYGLVVSPQRVAHDVAGLARRGPQSLGATLAQQLEKVAASDHAGLTAGLVVSVVLALWTASAGVYNLERAIRTAYGIRRDEYVRARARAVVGAIIAVVALGAVALLSTMASVAVDYAPVVVSAVVGVPLLVLLVVVVIAAAYRSSIGVSVSLRRLLPGAVTASVGLGIVVGGFAVYLRFSTRYTAVYGALAGTVIGMIGTYLGVYVVLLGAVLNAQLDDARRSMRGDGDPGTGPRSRRRDG